MKFSKDSWVNQLVKQYEKVSVENIDKANKIITNALFKLEELNRKGK